MKSVRMALIVCFLLVLASCSLKPTWDLIGKWESTEGNETIQFFQNGIVTLDSQKTILTTGYAFTDPEHVKINVGSLGSFKLAVSIKKDDLALVDADGIVKRYKRVK